MDRENRNKLIKIAASAVLLAVAVIIEKTLDLRTWQLLLIYLVPYLLAGYETLGEAVESLLEGEPLDEDFLMSVATIGALAIGFLPGAQTQFPEAVFVMLFFQVGELFEELSEERSRRSISHLMDIRPDTAEVERNGSIITVSPDEVSVGEIVVVKPGGKVPMDGMVYEGRSSLNTVALTGESLPRDVEEGDAVFSGCINTSGLLKVRVTRPFGESTASRILDLVENASENKSRSEKFITRFARVYTPVVVGLAVLLAVVPPLFSGAFGTAFPIWLYRALTFLIVSCPCALVISVPLAFFAGIGGASRKGILVKGGSFLETLAKTGTVMFDKTGTLTHGVFEVTAVHPETLDAHELLHLAAHVERHSTHPVAVSLKNAFPGEDDCCTVTGIGEIAGKGARAEVNGKTVYVGNSTLMDEVGAAWKPCTHTGTIVHVSLGDEYAGHIVVSDRVKENAAAAISSLRGLGVEKTVMLTGDNPEVAAEVAAAVGVDEFHASLLPQDKVEMVDRMRGQGTVAFVGDGINDAPVLSRADVGIAMGALGSDAAIEAADVVLMDDSLGKIADAVRIARKTLGIAGANTCFAIGVKVIVLVLAALGYAPMWLAVFADVGVTVLAVLNSMRALKA